jgi:hypothetical protein
MKKTIFYIYLSIVSFTVLVLLITDPLELLSLSLIGYIVLGYMMYKNIYKDADNGESIFGIAVFTSIWYVLTALVVGDVLSLVDAAVCGMVAYGYKLDKGKKE